jgi:hypothetical protein
LEAKALTPRDLFDGKVSYEVPAFQRPYVWTEEDQWQPLWDDIQRVTDAVLGGEEVSGHFLGSVVLKQIDAPVGEPSRWSIIDGQQRLTTLQILLDAAQLVAAEHGEDEDAETLLELVYNSSKRFAGSSKRFKLWPSRIDRAAFESVMDNGLTPAQEIIDSRIVQAHRFFNNAIVEWAIESTPSQLSKTKIATLTKVLEQYLHVVAITLGPTDEDQLIFETLNDRGTPLLAADLIKNFVFDRCEKLGVAADVWADKYWQEFDSDWWREEVSQGRLFRARIDLFLQYWLTMRTLSEVPSDSVFANFRHFASARLSSAQTAEHFLEGLRKDADTFRRLASLDEASPEGKFYHRVVEALELGAFIPLLIWLISDNHSPPDSQVRKALHAVESWAVRRTLLRRTMKDVNKMVVALLQNITNRPLSEVGDATVEFLNQQSSDAREWPTDVELRNELPAVKIYGNIKQPRVRTILAAIEQSLRTARHESVSLPSRLEIEHIMPRGWREHWGTGVANDPQRSAEREKLVNTIGNLTLVTQKLNNALSNRPWTDSEALIVAPTGQDAGLGKRSLLNRFSILVLNKLIVDQGVQAWTDQDVRNRGQELTEAVIRVWPRSAGTGIGL